tara:strand:+ start:21 stop:872 length:852 start_codon:yes stop_codon:yes gene_type:complete
MFIRLVSTTFKCKNTESFTVMTHIYINFNIKEKPMKKYIYILLITLNHFLIAQENQIAHTIPKNMTGEIIISKYLNKIEITNSIEDIRTLQKLFTIEIEGVPNMQITGEVIYQKPNLYYSVVNIQNVGQIQSTRYDGTNCIVTRKTNNDIIEKNIKGKMLEEKKKDFEPFPIIKQKNDTAKFTIIEMVKFNNTNTYKMYIDTQSNKKVFLFFDEKSYLLVKKETIEGQTTKIIEYQDYKNIDGILYPFIEINTTKINEKIAQKSTNKITEILVNESFSIEKFQ